MLSVEQQLEKQLEKRKAENALRTLSLENNGVDFYSNDYLGLSKKTILHKGTNGSTGSRLISGNSAKAENLELYLASFHKADSALLYNSGYDANLGLLSCVANRNDTIIIDELCHASIYDGVRLSNAKVFKFKHNTTEELERKLKNATGNIFVVVEAVYSMDGDFSPLEEIVKVCNRFEANLIVDEAHSTGVFGENGEGRVVELALQQYCFARLYTFGKALGCHGAVIVGSKMLRDYLINFSRSFIYTTALPESALDIIKGNYQFLYEVEERENLVELIRYFKSKFNSVDLIESESPIQSIVISGNDNVKQLAKSIQLAGINVKAILHPTVPKGLERIRICLHSFNTFQEIDALHRLITKAL